MSMSPVSPGAARPRCGSRLGGAVLLVATMLAGASSGQQVASRQVTVFGILATPGSSQIDPQLKTIAPQLQQLLPNHGFKLLEAQSRRLTPGQSVTCTKLNGYQAEAQLVTPLDANGKVQLQFAIGTNGMMQAATIVATPPNQLSFFDKPFSDGSRLILGVGAR